MSDAYAATFGPQQAPTNPPQGPGQAYAQLLGQPATAPASAEFAPVLQDVAKAYPALAPHVLNTVIVRGQPSGPDDDRQLEYYGPTDEDNPNPGKITLQIFNPALQGPSLREAAALDMLHFVGGQDAKGQPNDPKYQALKQQVVSQIVAAKRPMDSEAYKEEIARYPGYSPSYEDWIRDNRSDAYIRAMVNPAMNPEWTKPGIITPEMQKVGDQIKRYLKGQSQ